MAVSITEYAGGAYLPGGQRGVVPMDLGLNGAQSSVITTTVLSSATTSTMTLLPTTTLIRIGATANAWVLCSASSASTSIATSTNAAPVFPNVPELRAVKPGSRLTCLST
jgi:hypothetical protein